LVSPHTNHPIHLHGIPKVRFLTVPAGIPLAVTVGKNRAAVVDNIFWQDIHVVMVKFWDQDGLGRGA